MNDHSDGFTAGGDSPSLQAIDAAVDGRDADPAPDGTSCAVAPRPDHVPEKFWDAETGEVRTDALIKSYQELERRMGAKPESADSYRIETSDPAFAVDPAVNEALYTAGLTNEQAQTVYGLAEQVLAPMAESLAAEMSLQRDVDWLAARHGGEEAWRKMVPQVKRWGASKLPPDVYRSMAASREGVAAMVKMMQGDEPAIGNRNAANPTPISEASVKAMMRDPRYWRDQDPAVVAKVREGFERLYPD